MRERGRTSRRTKRVVGLDLRPQPGQRRLVAGELVLLEQLLDPVEVEAGVAEVLLDLRPGRAEEGRVAAALSAMRSSARTVRGVVPGTSPAYLRRRTSAAAPPLRRDLVVEQRLQARGRW